MVSVCVRAVPEFLEAAYAGTRFIEKTSTAAAAIRNKDFMKRSFQVTSI
jgi:hypothetical protein